MESPDSWLVLGFLGALVLVPVLCATLAVLKGGRVALAGPSAGGATGLRGRVLMTLGQDLENDGASLAERVRDLVGAENRVTLRDLLVLVNKPTETIAPKNVTTTGGS